MLHEAIETVPANKIFAFGGDYIVPEGSYGHSVMARRVVSRVLTEKVEDGYLTEEEAAAWRGESCVTTRRHCTSFGWTNRGCLHGC